MAIIENWETEIRRREKILMDIYRVRMDETVNSGLSSGLSPFEVYMRRQAVEESFQKERQYLRRQIGQVDSMGGKGGYGSSDSSFSSQQESEDMIRRRHFVTNSWRCPCCGIDLFDEVTAREGKRLANESEGI